MEATLSKQLARDHASGDFGRALEGYSEIAKQLEDALLSKCQQLNAANSLIRTYREEFDKLEKQILALQAALAAKDVELKRFLDSHEECTDFDGFTAQIVSLDDYHEAQEALDIKPGDAEVRKLVAKHVRKAYEYRMTYASQIEDGSAPL